MRFIAGPVNKQWLKSLFAQVESCTRVRAAVAYANKDNMMLFEYCERNMRPLEFYGRYDHTVPVHPELLKWFLDRASPNLDCKLVPDILHSKVIWWMGAGAYIGSANLTQRAWDSNIEAGTFMTHDELVKVGMDGELQRFFEVIDFNSRPLTKEIYQEQLQLARDRKEISTGDFGIERKFDKKRLIPKNRGLLSMDVTSADEKGFQEFEKDWTDTLARMRSIAIRVSAPGVRPAWIDPTVPAGVQADQFLHAYYYKQVKEGRRHPFEEFHAKNSKNPELALSEAMAWWHQADFEHSFEDRTIYEWSPVLRQLFARERILELREDEFINAISRVHSVRDHAVKQENEHLGLSEKSQDVNDKVQKYGEWLWRQKSVEGKTVLELLNYVVWGGGPVAQRLWNGIESRQWKIKHIGISSLGEIVGWARPDDYPPRNKRTSKGLKALGFNVNVG